MAFAFPGRRSTALGNAGSECVELARLCRCCPLRKLMGLKRGRPVELWLLRHSWFNKTKAETNCYASRRFGSSKMRFLF